jgi:lipopolysaccharide assembly outer membrane protein LptD (OstA)
VRELNVVAAHDTTEDTSSYRAGVTDVLLEETGDTETGERPELEIEEGRLPWSFVVDASYSTTKAGDPRATVRMFAQMDLTESWRLNYSTLYDVFAREQTGQSISITRDLHCWAMSLERQRIGREWQFYFRIELKAHPDIYGESGSRGLRGGTLGTGSFF